MPLYVPYLFIFQYVHTPFSFPCLDSAYIWRVCGHGDMGTGPHQVLAATLILFQPGGEDYAHRILMSPPSFERHRRTWNHLCTPIAYRQVHMDLNQFKIRVTGCESKLKYYFEL